MASSRFLTLLLLISFLVPSAGASPLCGDVFRVHKMDSKEGLFATLKGSDSPLFEKRIMALAQELMVENFLKMAPGAIPGQFDPRLYDVHSITRTSPSDSNGYARFQVQLYNKFEKDVLLNDQFEIRSNGNAAFLGATYRYRSKSNGEGTGEKEFAKHYKAVYFEKGFIRTLDQGETLLMSMPQKFQLSRSMSQTERNRWIDGGDFWSSFGQKVHFAPEFFKFDKEPYLVPVLRQDLLEAYRRGDLEINVYDDHSGRNGRRMAMPGPIKLEFELVFIGQGGVETLRPMLRDVLRQGILPYPN